MTEGDTRLVEQTVHIAARPETVWRYWTDPERLRDWWGAAAEVDPRAGGMCRIESEAGFVMSGHYLELVPHERIVFSFGWEDTPGAPAIAPGSSRVEVTLTEEAGGTLLTLRHTGIPPAAADDHQSGWTHHLSRLAAAAASAAAS